MKNSKAGSQLNRKQFLRNIAALSAMPLMPFAGYSANPDVHWSPEHKDSQTDTRDLLIKGGRILSMDETTGDLASGDIYISNGKISAVGEKLPAKSAKIIDAAGMLVMPGLVETHWHAWTSLLRSIAGTKPGIPYFEITSKFGKLFTPDDMFTGTRIAMQEAAWSGITTVHDWCHNVRSIDHAEASIQAIAESGLRGRFSVGLPAGASQQKDSIDLDTLQRLANKYKHRHSDGSDIYIGLAWPEAGTDARLRQAELEAARSLKIPITVHAGRKPDGSDAVTHIRKFLGPDLQIVHGVKTGVEELKMIAAAGSSLTISPYSELRIGYGIPPIPEMLRSGIPLGLSVDTFPLSGNADLFNVMKVFLNLANGLSHDEFIVDAKRILQMATIEGARSMGLDKITGSITPGKSADIIMIETRSPNMIPLVDPAWQIVTAVQPSNVDTVIAQGKILKQHGRLLKPVADLHRTALSSVERLKKTVGW